MLLSAARELASYKQNNAAHFHSVHLYIAVVIISGFDGFDPGVDSEYVKVVLLAICHCSPPE